MEKKLAIAFSWLFHPVWMPFYATLLLFFQPTLYSVTLTAKAKLIVGLIIFLNTVLIPGMMISLMKSIGLIESLQMNKRTERTLPLVIMSFSYMAAFYMLRKLGVPEVFNVFIIGGFFSVIAVIIINTFWKISMHMMGMGGLTGGFIALSMALAQSYFPVVLFAILISGLTGFARLKQEAHHPAQIYAGWITGFVILFSVVWYFL